ncbi:MAG: terpene cyclase/mutase family protein [Planctomycetota bacterium]|nr:terpene cyclase/mutase family protein [Planctomycetota bacterium]
MSPDQRAFSFHGPSRLTAGQVSGTPSPSLGEPLQKAVQRTRRFLLTEQETDGYWVGELEGDAILQGEFILLLAWLGREHEPIAKKCAQHLLDTQIHSGGWAMYPGGPIEISASVKAYFALKLTGHDPNSPAMQRAKKAILAAGGADCINSFTRFYLALLGQIEYKYCPTVPPEFVLLPKWFPINLYAISCWSRTILVPLSIMSAHQPVRHIEPARGIQELFIRQPADWPVLRCPGLKRGRGLLSWDRFFRTLDRGLKFLQRTKMMPCRKRAITAAKNWMVERFAGSDGLGAIFPGMVWGIVALRCMGYKDNSPELRYCYERLDGHIIEEADSARLQPCKSPVWDTAITLRALHQSGLPAEHESVEAAVDWLLDNEVRFPGDWSQTVKAEPGGWCFEYANQFYPDLDDTSMVVMALHDQLANYDGAEKRLVPPPAKTTDVEGDTLKALLQQQSASLSRQATAARSEAPLHLRRLQRSIEAIQRGESWMLAMQNRDGGWGAFDKDNNREFLCHVPFADHNAMIDPSTPDLTARVLESLGQLGRRVGDAAVDRAVKYLRATQETDGSWYGRWGVNYIYGTWQTVVGLTAVGVPTNDPAVVAGADWLLAYQQTNGGWGESCDSYADPTKRGQGNTTASQTAWAILGLIAAGRQDDPAVARGVQYLISQQRPDGGWDEPEFTGTGFPRVFYLRYHMYPIYFPLLALSQYARRVQPSVAGVQAAIDQADQCGGFPLLD